MVDRSTGNSRRDGTEDVRLDHLWWIFLLAVLSRVLLLLLKPPAFPPGWGGEMASVALALVTDRGFSDPYWFPTGPTALVPPVYPFLLSGFFWLFGPHTVLAGQVAFGINVILSALVTWPLYLLGRELGGKRLGLLAALLWALYPLTGFSDVLMLWSTSLFTLILTCSILWTVRIRRERGAMSWVLYGAFLGVMGLTETVGLLVVACALAWLLVRERVSLGLVALAFLITALPAAIWLSRNLIVFDQPVFLRSNFGLELYLSITYDDLDRLDGRIQLPNRDPKELEQLVNLGEHRYMQTKKNLAFDWIAEQPGRWIVILARRYLAFWTGNAFIASTYWSYGNFVVLKHILFALPALLGLAGTIILQLRRQRAASLLAAIFAVYPLTYILALTFPRYRLPIEPLLILGASVTLLTLIYGAGEGECKAAVERPNKMS